MKADAEIKIEYEWQEITYNVYKDGFLIGFLHHWKPELNNSKSDQWKFDQLVFNNIDIEYDEKLKFSTYKDAMNWLRRKINEDS